VVRQIVAAAIALAAGAIGAAVTIAGPAKSTARPVGPHSTPPPLVIEHRYRIAGKIRLGFVWARRNDVGSARITWRADDGGTAISLLAGSDPLRAPRRLNQWGYVREETRADASEVFTVRSSESETTAGSPSTTDASTLAVACASMKGVQVRSVATKVAATGTTYRMFDRLLDQIVTSPANWDERHVVRPADAEAGFLTALRRVLLSSEAASSAKTLPSVAYVFNNRVYDLVVRQVRPLGQVTVGARTFDRLTRGDLAIRNRVTGGVTRFGVTYEPGGANGSLPVQIFFPLTSWVSIELALDDAAEAPADPGGDQSMLTTIRRICESAAF
jgi:hypothetical protein